MRPGFVYGGLTTAVRSGIAINAWPSPSVAKRQQDGPVFAASCRLPRLEFLCVNHLSRELLQRDKATLYESQNSR